MTMQIVTLQEKIDAIEAIVVDLRKGGMRKTRASEIMKAIASDLNARAEFPRGHALGTIRRQLVKLKESKTPLGYEATSMIALANIVIHHWSTIEQALEQFGEETAE